MTSFVRANVVNVCAVATASVVALGLVTTPPDRYEPVIARAEVAAIQLQAAISTQVATLANAAATSTLFAPAGTDVAIDPPSPRASATGPADALAAIATAAIALAATPLWYVAFPITLPLSVVGGIAAANFSAVWSVAVGGGYDPVVFSLIGAVIGLGLFAVGPLGIAVGAISSLFTTDPYFFPAAAQQPASPASAVSQSRSAVPATSEQTHEADRGTLPTAPAPVASPTKRERGATQRGAGVATSAAVAAAPAELIPSTAATQDTTAAPETPARSDLMSDAADMTAAGGAQEAPTSAPVSSSDRPAKSTAQTSAGQRGDSSASTRTGRTSTE